MNKKRIVSFILALIILLQSLSLPVYAIDRDQYDQRLSQRSVEYKEGIYQVDLYRLDSKKIRLADSKRPYGLRIYWNLENLEPGTGYRIRLDDHIQIADQVDANTYLDQATYAESTFPNYTKFNSHINELNKEDKLREEGYLGQVTDANNLPALDVYYRNGYLDLVPLEQVDRSFGDLFLTGIDLVHLEDFYGDDIDPTIEKILKLEIAQLPIDQMTEENLEPENALGLFANPTNSENQEELTPENKTEENIFDKAKNLLTREKAPQIIDLDLEKIIDLKTESLERAYIIEENLEADLENLPGQDLEPQILDLDENNEITLELPAEKEDPQEEVIEEREEVQEEVIEEREEVQEDNIIEENQEEETEEEIVEEDPDLQPIENPEEGQRENSIFSKKPSEEKSIINQGEKAQRPTSLFKKAPVEKTEEKLAEENKEVEKALEEKEKLDHKKEDKKSLPWTELVPAEKTEDPLADFPAEEAAKVEGLVHLRDKYIKIKAEKGQSLTLVDLGTGQEGLRLTSPLDLEEKLTTYKADKNGDLAISLAPGSYELLAGDDSHHIDLREKAEDPYFFDMTDFNQDRPLELLVDGEEITDPAYVLDLTANDKKIIDIAIAIKKTMELVGKDELNQQSLENLKATYKLKDSQIKEAYDLARNNSLEDLEKMVQEEGTDLELSAQELKAALAMKLAMDKLGLNELGEESISNIQESYQLTADQVQKAYDLAKTKTAEELEKMAADLETDLEKADAELKAALADENNGIEEIQALLDSFEEKYNLSKEDQQKLMDDNGDALRALVEKDREHNFRPQILAAIDKTNLDGKKFNILTRFDTSTAVGPIKKDQYFRIHLDEKLTVKDEKTLEPIKYNNEVIANPKYNPTDNTITYTITKDITENIQVPLNIPVDYNTDKIKLDDNGEFVVINKVSGLGVKAPKDLLPQRVDGNGNLAGSIIEPDRKDVTEIITPDDSNYKIYTDAVANPVIKDGELVGYNWTIKVSSDTDLDELGYKANFTTVKGSGLGEITSRDNNVTLTKQLDRAFGINDSKHHDPTPGTREVTYNLYTPTNNKQEKYMMDISIILTNKNNKLGAKRIVINEGWPIDKVKDATPSRVGMNNRTTVLGEFANENQVKWTVTDAVSTGDENTKLPLEQRQGQVVGVYKLDSNGQMVAEDPKDLSNAKPVGTIAVFEHTTNQNEKDPHEFAGVKVSKYQDITVNQNWNLDQGLTMPEMTVKAVDPNNEETVLGEATTKESGDDPNPATRTIIIEDTKIWNIGTDGTATRNDIKIKQEFPTGKTYNNKPISYYENNNWKDPNADDTYHIHNRATVEAAPQFGNFTLIKTGEEGKPLPGAIFKLLGQGEAEVATDKEGKIRFQNIAPGSYTLMETKAPNGYKLNQERTTVNVDENGRISTSGSSAKLEVGGNPTVTVAHNVYPDFMNAMQYATVNEDGSVTTYIYLKANEAKSGGSTDKDTRLNLRLNNSINGKFSKIDDVKVYDVNPYYREYLKTEMIQQGVDENTINWIGNTNVLKTPNTNRIVPTLYVKDAYTQQSGYRIKFPQERFKNDWGFLVVANSPAGTSVTYDWLMDDNNNTTVGNNARLQDQTINPTTAEDAKKETTITISNEKFETRPVEVNKWDKDQNGIAGATFEIRDAETKRVIATVDSQAADEEGKNKGLASFGDLPEGKYIIEEIKAPEGYVKSDVVFDVTVDESNQVTYKPRFKTKTGTPINGVDYFIKDVEQSQDNSKAKIKNINTHTLKINEDDEGDAGIRPGVWEAYRLESLIYNLEMTLESSSPGQRFSIQFDRNLDFTQYFGEFPKLNIRGVDVADPYFDYTTNKLTYVFNEKSEGGEATAEIELKGIIPSKYFAQNDGEYPFTVTVEPGQTVTGNNQTITTNVPADYGYYDYDRKNKEPTQSYYFRDVYQGEDGNWYVAVLAYYNPHHVRTSGPKELKFNWLSTNYQGVYKNFFQWEGNGNDPAFSLNKVNVYRTSPNMGKVDGGFGEKSVNYNMPLSFGVRPGDDPAKYNLVYSKTIDPRYAVVNDRQGLITLNYDPSQIQRFGLITENSPLRVTMPPINAISQNGYIIEQTFKIDDMNKFNNLWRVFLMQNNAFKSSFITRANYNKAIGDQAGGEPPKFFSQEVALINKKYEPGNFKIKKLNDADRTQTLQGASFSLTGEAGNTIYRSSGQDGIVDFKNLKPGIYTLREEKAPNDFIKSDKTWRVNVSIDGSISIQEIGLGSSGETIYGKTITLDVTNKPVATEFTVYKKDNQDQPLQGAEFKITDTNGNQIATGSSDANGKVTFNGNLENGKTYILEETKAPAGFVKTNKKWVLQVGADGKTKVYNKIEGTTDPTDENVNKSILGVKGTNWVNVSKRSVNGWNLGDNRQTGYFNNWPVPYKLGTRIVGINTSQNYVIQRYVINPEAAKVTLENASIHREKPWFENMEWYKGDGTEAYKIFKLDKAIDGDIEDIRLENYKLEELTIKGEKKTISGDERLYFNFNNMVTDKPIVIDVKVPYKSLDGGVGTGMDLTANNTVYWKSDYYEKASGIVKGEEIVTTGEAGNIKGAYISEGSLDVSNDRVVQKFSFKKVDSENQTDAVTGATFSLQGPKVSDDDLGPQVWKRSGKDGIVNFDDLTPGIYKLTETGPAQGYEASNTDWTVTVTKDGKVYIRDNNKTPVPEGAQWQKITNLTGEDTNRDRRGGQNAMSYITEVDLAHKKYKQVFVLNRNRDDRANYLEKPSIQIHSYPESRDITSANTTITGVYEVDRTSTPDKLINKNSINYTTGTASKEGWNRIVIYPDAVANKTIAVEIEADLPNGAFGTGTDLINERPNLGKDVVFKSWTAEQYYDQSKLQLEPLPPTGTDRNAVVYVGGETDDQGPNSFGPLRTMAFRSQDQSIELQADQESVTAQVFSSVVTPGTNLPGRILEEYMTGKQNKSLEKQIQAIEADANAEPMELEIGDELVGNSLGAGNVEYTVNPLATKNYGGVDVATTVTNLGSGKFEIEIHMTNVKAGSRAIGAEFELKFNDNFTFVPDSTKSWKGLDETTKWHTSYIAADNKIGVQNGEPRIGLKQIAKIKFQVQAKSDLQSGTYQLIQPIKYKHDDRATQQTIEPPTVTVKRSEPVISYRYGFEEETIEVITEYRNDPNLEVGKTRTEEGQAGTKRTYYKYKIVDGTETGEKTIDTTKGNNGIEIITEMKPKIIYTGTKQPGQTGYTVSYSAPQNGTLSVSPTSANAGDTITVTATPNDNYKLKSLYYKDDNNNKVTINGNSFAMPASNVTVYAEFEEDKASTYTITVNQPTEGGSISANLASATAGTEVTLTANPKPGYVLDSFTVTADNNETVTVTNGKFTMPASNVSVSATFKKSEDPIDSFVPEEGKDILVPDGETAKIVKITNKKAGITPKVLKRDPGGNPVAGAKFSIKKMTDDTYETVDTSFTEVTGEADKDGNVIFKDKTGNTVKLKKGYYILKETESPKGYKEATTDWKLEVKDTGGRMYMVYQGPEETAASLINNNEKANAGKSASNDQIKYKARLTYIDPETKTYVQRIYIDTRDYKGSDQINVQIRPKYKREEIDVPGESPTTTKGGVKTAYYTAYRITDPANNPDIGSKNFENIDLDTMLRTYDLSRSDLSMIKTARWRPFGWGFDEDQLNLDKGGVYIVDVEGFYDDAIITGLDKYLKDEEGNPTDRTELDKTSKDYIDEKDLGKLDLNLDFYDGARNFEQAVYNEKTKQIEWKVVPKGNYQAGNAELKKAGQDVDALGTAGGRISPDLGKPTISRNTSADLNPLYNSEKTQEVPKEGLEVINERETYNITFSKHGRDGKKEDGWGDNSEKVTKNRLEGAVFRLEVRGPGGIYEEVPGTTVASAFNGYFGFRGLKPGRYRLVEVKAPPGYRPIKDPILYMTISYQGEVVDGKTGEVTPGRGLITFEYNKDSNGIIQYAPDKEATEKDGKLVDYVTSATAKNMGKIINELPGKGRVELTKLNDNENILPGAKFKLTRLTSEEVINPGDKEKPDGIYYGEANKDGKVIFEDLPIGQYELEETEAPDGYINKGQKWRFTVGGPGLDPYINEGETPIRDISSKISFESSEMTVVRPDANDGTESEKNSAIHPHKGHALAFKNKFKLSGDGDIKEGDYFTIKLTDNIDLEGILRGNTSGLDLFADGIGTIAKAKYDKEAGTLTYIFTSYAEQYSMTEFENTISAHINLYKVPSSSDSETVGLGIYDKDKKTYIGEAKTNNIKVNYDLDMAEQSLDLNDQTEAYKLNMTSKIVSFDTETGDFVQYYYINRDMKEARKLVFNYTPNTAVSNLRFDVINLRQNYGSIYDYNTGKYVNPITRDMPESFGVNENSNNLSWNSWYGYYNLNANQTVPLNLGGYGQYDSMILKVTGRVDTKNIASYETFAKLFGSKIVQDQYGRVYEYPSYYVTRTNGVRIFENKANASAELKFTAINPKNEITFKKVDEDGAILKGAKFELHKKNSEGNWVRVQSSDKTSGEDGLVKFEKLSPGEYALVETKAPEGYTKVDGHLVEFTVVEDGSITRKVLKEKKTSEEGNLVQKARALLRSAVNAVTGKDNTETVTEAVSLEPIEVVNYKDIEFVKVDGEDTSKTLAGAVFEVHYKEKEDGKYEPIKVNKTAEDGTETDETMTVTSGEDGKFTLNITKDGYYALKEIKAPDGYTKIPGKIREFKVENGKIQTLEKDPLKASHKTSTKGLLTSEILEVDKKDNTFKQRIIINPNHKEMTVPSYQSYIRILENDWKITPKYKKANGKAGIGGEVNVALLKKDGDKTLADLKDTDFTKFDANSFTTAGNDTGSRYGLKEMLGVEIPEDKPITTTDSIVMEFTGKLDDGNKTGTADQLFELVFESGIDDQISDALNVEALASRKPTYGDHKRTEPIQIENRQTKYPLTGGMGTIIFSIAGISLMTAAAYVYRRKREVSYGE